MEGFRVAVGARRRARLRGSSAQFFRAVTTVAKVLHQTPGRIRLGVPRLKLDDTYANRLQCLLESVDNVRSIRISVSAASVVVHFRPETPGRDDPREQHKPDGGIGRGVPGLRRGGHDAGDHDPWFRPGAHARPPRVRPRGAPRDPHDDSASPGAHRQGARGPQVSGGNRLRGRPDGRCIGGGPGAGFAWGGGRDAGGRGRGARQGSGCQRDLLGTRNRRDLQRPQPRAEALEGHPGEDLRRAVQGGLRERGDLAGAPRHRLYHRAAGSRP